MAQLHDDTMITINNPQADDHRRMMKAIQWEHFYQAVTNVPVSEVLWCRQVTGDEGGRHSDMEIAAMIALNRRMNRICENCGDKSAPTQLRACGKCYLLYYCSRQCQRAHWLSGHRHSCCNPEAGREKGYSASVIFPTDGPGVVDHSSAGSNSQAP